MRLVYHTGELSLELIPFSQQSLYCSLCFTVEAGLEMHGCNCVCHHRTYTQLQNTNAAKFTHLVGLRHGHAFLHQELDNFIVVGVRGEDDGRDVRGEIRELLVE